MAVAGAVVVVWKMTGAGCGCLIAVLCVAAVLAILVYVVVPVAIVVGCVFLLYLFIKKLLTSASFRRFVWRVLLCFFVVGCVIGIARGVAYIFFLVFAIDDGILEVIF